MSRYRLAAGLLAAMTFAAGAQTPAKPAWTGLGRAATPAEIKAWDIDVRPHRLGIANMVVPHDELLAAATTLAQAMLKNGPLALARALEAVDRGLEMTLEAGIALESELFGSLADTDDMREGTTAFLEKRPAAFRGK